MMGLQDTSIALLIAAIALASLYKLDGTVISLRKRLDHADEVRARVVINPLHLSASIHCGVPTGGIMECTGESAHYLSHMLFVTGRPDAS